MKSLWQRAVGSLRDHPSLVAPVFGAALLSCGWGQVRFAFIHHLLPWMLTLHHEHSVLAGDIGSGIITPLQSAVAYAASFIVSTACELFDVCGYFVAMLMTSALMQRLGLIQSGDTRLNPRRDGIAILRISALSFLLMYGSIVIVSFPGLYWLFHKSENTFRNNNILGIIAATLGYIALAYFVAPMALKLLAKSGDNFVGPTEARLGRQCSLLAVLAVTSLSAIQLFVRLPSGADSAARTVFAVVSTIVVALPYAPLFVTFGLIATTHRASESREGLEVEPSALDEPTP